MKIENIKASAHAFEARVPLLKDPVELRKIVFCELETDDGIVGYGMTGHFLTSAVVAALRNDFLPLVRGMDPRDTEAIHQRVGHKLNPRAMTGVVSSALSALDIACWDAHGKQAGRTCAQLLGGCRDWAPVYITFGFPEYTTEQLVEAARAQVARGFTRLKMVVAVDPKGWMEDVRRVQAVRAAVGENIELMCDANYMYNPVEARLFLQAVEDCRLSWMEEPLHQNDARALHDLRRTTRVPIAAGQMEGHRWRLRELVDHQAVDILQPNCAYNGGYTETCKAAHLAQVFNLPIANGGGWPRLNMHTMAGLMNGWRVEFHLGMTCVEEQLWTNAPLAQDDIIRLNPEPGLGLTPDKDALRDTVLAADRS